MMRIKKSVVLDSIFRLKDTSNNKLWGLICLFCVTNNQNPIEGNFTYVIDSDSLAYLLQDIFYFGDNIREFNSDNRFYYRLSEKWDKSILDYLTTEKLNILDAAIYFYKAKDFNSSISTDQLVSGFVSQLNIPNNILRLVFSLSFANEDIELDKVYPKKEILDGYKKKFSLSTSHDTLSFDTPFTVKSRPSEFKRAPFIQTLYSGSKIQELILLTDFNLDDFYPKSIVSRQEQKSGINKIYYGAPGTGKSFKVNEYLADKSERVERITFHPEFDYSQFIGSYRPTMKDNDIRYEFVPQVFTKIYIDAWNDLENDYYLVIEEINRGNCAEIFGDIFQLLDRQNNYAITPSVELSEYLEVKFLDNNKIDGQKLVLPPNLNLLATMNTSDQSLFPMDSAFKRRWEWEYIPINYDFSDKNISSKFRVIISPNESFSWLAFIKAVNNIIKDNSNLGMDKCLGNFFITPDNNIIELETFINKVVFYLWNDVFKDEINEGSIFQERTTYEDFFPIKPNGLDSTKELLNYLGIKILNTSSNQ